MLQRRRKVGTQGGGGLVASSRVGTSSNRGGGWTKTRALYTEGTTRLGEGGWQERETKGGRRDVRTPPSGSPIWQNTASHSVFLAYKKIGGERDAVNGERDKGKRVVRGGTSGPYRCQMEIQALGKNGQDIKSRESSAAREGQPRK